MFETGGAIPAEALFLEYREASGEILPPRYFRGPMVPRGCVRSRPPGRCRLILPTLQLMRGRTRGSKRCVGTSRRRSPRRRSRRGRRVSGRSPKTAFPSSAPCGVLTVPDLATGHSVWGMLNAPATGEAMSELILDGAAAARRPHAIRAGDACRRLIRRVCAASQSTRAIRQSSLTDVARSRKGSSRC